MQETTTLEDLMTEREGRQVFHDMDKLTGPGGISGQLDGGQVYATRNRR